MTLILPGPLPEDALLKRYESQDGCYTDCFQCKVKGLITLPEFVHAFYTTHLFRAERVVLKYGVRRPSTDAQARAIAYGEAADFAAWDLEERTETQLLMCDMQKATRSWFMVQALEGSKTMLRFGSAVTPKGPYLSLPVRLLMPLHQLYSRLLLKGAANRLAKPH